MSEEKYLTREEAKIYIRTLKNALHKGKLTPEMLSEALERYESDVYGPNSSIGAVFIFNHLEEVKEQINLRSFLLENVERGRIPFLLATNFEALQLFPSDELLKLYQRMLPGIYFSESRWLLIALQLGLTRDDIAILIYEAVLEGNASWAFISLGDRSIFVDRNSELNQNSYWSFFDLEMLQELLREAAKKAPKEIFKRTDDLRGHFGYDFMRELLVIAATHIDDFPGLEAVQELPLSSKAELLQKLDFSDMCGLLRGFDLPRFIVGVVLDHGGEEGREFFEQYRSAFAHFNPAHLYCAVYEQLKSHHDQPFADWLDEQLQGFISGSDSYIRAKVQRGHHRGTSQLQVETNDAVYLLHRDLMYLPYSPGDLVIVNPGYQMAIGCVRQIGTRPDGKALILAEFIPTKRYQEYREVWRRR